MNNKSFEINYAQSNLSHVLNMAKTLSKKECEHIYNYFLKFRPKKMLEFGVQYGCSTALFLNIAQWLNIDLELHSWDVVDVVRSECVDKKDFNFHLKDISGNENNIIDEYKPDLIFLDAHPYYLTRNITLACLSKKINFMMHDVNFYFFNLIKNKSNNFKNKEVYGAWEIYVLYEIFGDKILTNDCYEDDTVKINFIRDRFGLAIIEVK